MTLYNNIVFYNRISQGELLCLLTFKITCIELKNKMISVAKVDCFPLQQ